MKWVAIATAPDQLTAEMWRELLVNAGVPARVRPGDVASFLGVSGYPCRLMVPEDRADEALALLPQAPTRGPFPLEEEDREDVP